MTNAVKKIVRSYFGKTEINIDGLIEIFEQTGNADVALDVLMGTYVQLEIPHEATIWQKACTFKSFEKWTNKVHYTYEGPLKDYVYIDKNVDPKTITPENLNDYKRNYGDPNVQHVYITVATSVQHEDKCSLEEWLEGVERKKKHS